MKANPARVGWALGSVLVSVSAASCTAILGTFDFEGPAVGGGGTGGVASTTTAGGSGGVIATGGGGSMMTTTTTTSGSGGSAPTPKCDDGVKNGDETDIDCGGSCPNRCAWGQGCSQNEDCLTTFCDGTCGAGTVAIELGNCRDLQVDPPYAYLGTHDQPSDTHRLLKVPLNGGSPTTLAMGTGEIMSIAIGPGSVFFSAYAGTGSAIHKVPIMGGTVAPLVVTGSGTSLLAANSGNVYWANSVDGSVYGVPQAGGNAVELVAATGGVAFRGIAVRGTVVCWTDSNAGLVSKVSITGGSPSTLASAQPRPLRVAINATHVFWVNQQAPGGVLKVPIEGGSPIQLAPNRAYALAVDSTHVYFVEDSTPVAISKVPIDGGPVVTIASGLTSVNGFAADASYVYWEENSLSACTLRKAHK